MSYTVTIQETGDRFDVETGQSVLEAAEEAGLNLANDCRFGGCGTCRIHLIEGSVDYEEPPFGLTEEEADLGYGLACQARACSDLQISATVRPAGFIQPDGYSATIDQIEKLSEDVVHLVLRVPDNNGFIPGQYLNIMLDSGETRSFSMASPPAGEFIDFHIRQIENGHFTQALTSHYKPGDAVDVELPLGDFHYQSEPGKPLLMLATGTGLAPIKSIVQALKDTEDPPLVYLYWGGRQLSDLYMHEELLRLAQELDWLNYRPVLSRPDAEWQGARGYVQDVALQEWPDPTGFDVYLCGNPHMIKQAKKQLIQKGVDVDCLYSDSFVFAYQIDQAQ